MVLNNVTMFIFFISCLAISLQLYYMLSNRYTIRNLYTIIMINDTIGTTVVNENNYINMGIICDQSTT